VDFALDEAGDRAFGFCPATSSPIIYAVHSADGRVNVASLGVGAASNDWRATPVELLVFPPGDLIVTGDQQQCFTIPDDIIWNDAAATPQYLSLVDAEIRQQNVADTTGLSVMISRKRLSAPNTEGTADMVSACTTDAGEFRSKDDATGCVPVTGAGAIVQPGDRVCTDVDTTLDGEGLTSIYYFAPVAP
jgi:hypothetical protein